MIKYILPLLFLVGCGGTQTIGFTVVTDYVPTTDQAGPLTIQSNSIQVGGYVGQFKLEINNHNPGKLHDVHLLVTANDPTLVGDIFFSRIYHEIFWGGAIFTYPYPGSALAPEITPTITGYFADIEGDDLDPNGSVQFDSVVLGNAGLVLNFQIYAAINDKLVYADTAGGITVSYNY